MGRGEDKIIKKLELKGRSARDPRRQAVRSPNNTSQPGTARQTGCCDAHLGARIQLEAIAKRGWDELENITDAGLRSKLSGLRHWRKV